MDFKVRCIKSDGSRAFTEGEEYSVINGIISSANAEKPSFKISSVGELNQYYISQFELVTDKPHICEALGVEVGELFEVKGYTGCHYHVNFNGILLDGTDHCSSGAIYEIIEHPEKIIRTPQFSDDEKALMRMLVENGLSFIARDNDNGRLDVYGEPPTRRRNPDVWICDRDVKHENIPSYFFQQIAWENSPFNADSYLEAQK